MPNRDAHTPVTEIQTAARYLAEGEVDRARQQMIALASAVPAYASAHVLLAKAYEAAGNMDEALEAWHRAHFLVPGSPLVQRERRRLMSVQTTGGSFTTGESDVELEPVEPEKPLADRVGNGNSEQFVESAREDDDLSMGTAEDDLPEVFVDEGEPISDALGVEGAVGSWGEESRSVDPMPGKEEPVIVGPELDTYSDAAVKEVSGEVAWWKHTTGINEDREESKSDAGWSVVAETDTDEEEFGVREAQIAGPPEDGIVPGNSSAHTSPPSSSASLSDDLDSLIRELEDAPRIRPDPNFVGEQEEFDDDVADDMVSETLARIYVAQGQFAEAARVFEKLAEQYPEQSESYAEKAAEMYSRVGGD